jgi:sulfur carrier protein
MQITLNGKNRDTAPDLTLLGLLEQLGINPGSVVVEKNLRIVPYSELQKESLEEGDMIEIIRMVGGG